MHTTWKYFFRLTIIVSLFFFVAFILALFELITPPLEDENILISLSMLFSMPSLILSFFKKKEVKNDNAQYNTNKLLIASAIIGTLTSYTLISFFMHKIFVINNVLIGFWIVGIAVALILVYFYFKSNSIKQ